MAEVCKYCGKRLEYTGDYCDIWCKQSAQLAAAVAEKEQAERADAFHVEACAAHQAHIDELIADRDRLAGEVAALREAMGTIGVLAYCSRVYHAEGGEDPNEAALEGFTRIEEAASSAALAQSAPCAQGEAPADAKGGEG